MHAPSRLRSKLSVARGLGSAKHGVGHWWFQRLTAIALVPLGLWFTASLVKVTQSPDPFRVADWFASPGTAVMMVVMVAALFWHAKLGFQVVVEDYVKHPVLKYMLLVGNIFFCFALAVISALAILKLHLLDIAGGY